MGGWDADCPPLPVEHGGSGNREAGEAQILWEGQYLDITQPDPSSPYLVREAGGRGAATVVGDLRGQVPKRAAHSGVDTLVADTLVLVTALALAQCWRPVWRTGRRGHSSALLLPAG